MFNQVEVIKNLAENYQNLSPRDKEFADSLMAQAIKKKLSEKQLYWAGVLSKRKYEKKELPKEQLEGNFKPLLTMFQLAGTKLKYPKIRIKTKDGFRLMLKVAGERSKYKGQLMVTDGGSFGNNVYYGRVDKDGVLHYTNKMTPPIKKALNELSTDPVQAAKAYAGLSGECCFCGAELTDEVSKKNGYGPVCAKNYGLPYEK